MREVLVTARPADTEERESVEVKLDDFVLVGRCPKEATIARAAGVFSDKYASDTVLARTAFDFLETSLEPDSWAHVVGRMNDRDDAFDTEHLTAVFEALFDGFTEQMKADAPANRATRRAKPAAARH